MKTLLNRLLPVIVMAALPAVTWAADKAVCACAACVGGCCHLCGC
jgi:hypothetical protein